MPHQCVLLVLTLLGQLMFAQSQQCTGAPQCFCSRTTVRCRGVRASEVPNFPDSIRRTTTVLELGINLITSIRATDFQGFTSLRELDLSGNGISSIEEGSFSSNTALEEVNLANNNVRDIPDDLFESTFLLTLDLRGNLIANISASTFTGVQTGGTVLLDGNVIRSFPEDTFESIGGLYDLTLAGNPIRCDCELMWFPTFRDSIRQPSAIGTCDTPASLNGVSLNDITEDQLVCDCMPSCMNGACNTTVGECECDDGYIGEICDTPCPIGSFGEGCSQNCTCLTQRESSPCDNVNGTCHCLPGYTGSCDTECPDGFFGQDCLDVCQCENGDCNFITGFCNCSVGYVGVACNMVCPLLRFGLGCTQVCSCQTGACHHITGNCSCPIGYYGLNCEHNCTEASDCGVIGREECSLETPEQTCGPCLQGYVGEDGNGNSDCILCSGSPDCSALNREPCTTVVNTCGPCFQRHLTTLNEGAFSNQLCFDPCIDGIMNYDETDVDCGGTLCPPCTVNQACTGVGDCGIESVCLGFYVHPSGLDFPFNVQAISTCVAEVQPGNAISERFINALRGRDNPLPDIVQDPSFTLDALQASVEREIQEQFDIQEDLESIAISDLDQAPGDPLYQSLFKLSEGTEEGIDQMIENINNGKLSGTLLFNRRERRVLHNL